jgi:eukaryotic-like serine/threonine-protein kinase
LNSTLSPGDSLGPYEILARIGAGGMGEVWKARDSRLNRAVAIKRLKVEHSARFEAEARAIAALNHPHICQIFDIGPDYLVLEFVNGTPLRGPLPESEALPLAIQIAGALAAAHECEILHRDLKPDNVLVTRNGTKLLDFGLAKLVGEAATGVTQTGDGRVVGTPPYMSPEQARSKPLDKRSDIFSFGSLLYELLAGRRPFGGSDLLEVLTAVVSAEPVPLASPAWPVIERCLAKDPALRFQNAGELGDALQAVLKGAPTASMERISPAAPATPSIAVLPFANLSGDREQEYFSDGLAEDIINALTRTPGLRVIARTSAFAFKGQNTDVRKIAAALGVAHVMAGSVRRAGNRIRVTAQLIAAADGSNMWSERYDREIEDVFGVQDEIASAIAGMLEARLSQSGTTAAKYVPNVAAHESLLKARHFNSLHSPGALEQAEAYYRQAIDQDPRHALAHAGYAEHLFTRVQQGMLPAHEGMPRMRAEARTALELDPSLGEAHALLAAVAALYEYDWEEAERQYAKAIAGKVLSPGSRAFCALWVLRLMGRFEEAHTQAKLAAQGDPLSPQVQITLAFSLIAVGRIEEAEAQFRHVLQLFPGFMPALTGTAILYANQGRFVEAQVYLEKAYPLAPMAPFLLGSLAGALSRNGDTARAGELAARIRSGPAHGVNVGMMYYYLYSGDVERAADFAERVIEERYTGLSIGLTSDIAKPLRESARWPKLARLMNLPAGRSLAG